MNKNRGTGVNVGSSSIMVIFILLCLTTFATLSLVSAGAAMRLTDKTAVATQEYYHADAAAEGILKEIDQVLLENSRPQSTPDEFFTACAQDIPDKVPAASVQRDVDSLLVTYAVELNGYQQLQVSLRVPPAGSPDGRFAREQWTVVTTGKWKPESEGLNLWGGDMTLAEPPPPQ